MARPSRTVVVTASRGAGFIESERYGGISIVECPRCQYVGEPSQSYFDPMDVLSLIPYVGHLIYLFIRAKRKGADLRCAMCGYNAPRMLDPETARARLGHARYEEYIRQFHEREKYAWRLALLIASAIAIAGFLYYRLTGRF